MEIRVDKSYREKYTKRLGRPKKKKIVQMPFYVFC